MRRLFTSSQLVAPQEARPRTWRGSYIYFLRRRSGDPTREWLSLDDLWWRVNWKDDVGRYAKQTLAICSNLPTRREDQTENFVRNFSHVRCYLANVKVLFVHLLSRRWIFIFFKRAVRFLRLWQWVIHYFFYLYDAVILSSRTKTDAYTWLGRFVLIAAASERNQLSDHTRPHDYWVSSSARIIRPHHVFCCSFCKSCFA